jgi:RNA polymerase sigma factor (sigma-70 family)
MLHPVTTSFLARLRASDQAAWFELWQTFGPVLRAQLLKWGHGRIGPETAADLSQETLAELSSSIRRFDPQRGVRFSTWLLSIAKHVLGDELDKRSAIKRGGSGAHNPKGQSQSPASAGRTLSLDESWMIAHNLPTPDEHYEAAVFRAKVKAALTKVSQQACFQDFAIYRMRVLEGQNGKQVADALGISEPTVSRKASKVRDMLRTTLAEVVLAYSFTPDERDELSKQGLLPAAPHASTPLASTALASTPLASTPELDAAFDDALANVYHALTQDQNQDHDQDQDQNQNAPPPRTPRDAHPQRPSP